MIINTCSGNSYTYLQQTNEIVGGVAESDNFVWTFEPLKAFSDLPNVDTYIISITEQCNLRCTYCCYSGDYKNNRKHSTSLMSTKDIDEVFGYIQVHCKKDSLKVAFYGGEPLTNFSTLRYAILKARAIWGNAVEISVSTNGVLLTKDKVDWLVEQNVRLDISIDGGKYTHDSQRKDIIGNGSFEKIYAAISYINKKHPSFFKENVLLLMTLVSLSSLEQIAEEWHNDTILKKLPPTKISSISPNFAKGVPLVDYDEQVLRYIRLLDIYEVHRDWLVLKVFFDQCIAYWLNRPIIKVDGLVPMSTCLPKTNKLYIDSNKHISVCEKFCDKYPIGTINDGVDWEIANNIVKGYFGKRKDRCGTCPAIRMCNLCLTAVEYIDKEWDVLCHNERTYTKVCFRLFCEMAERGLIG